MNLPNKLTLLRIILVPFFVAALLIPSIPNHFLWALLLFAVASLTDHYDGKLARKYNQITTFGQFLDPVADKILVISALVCFIQLGLAEAWCVLLIIARDFIVTSIRLVAVDGGKVIAANRWGKTKTVSQIIAVTVILIFQSMQSFGAPNPAVGGTTLFFLIGRALIYAATLLTVFSGAVYIRENIGVINHTK